MKTFRELISWELEQEKKGAAPLHQSSQDTSGKLSSCMLRKLRHLSSAAASQANAVAPALGSFS